MMTLSNRLKGIILAVGGSIFWGMLIGGAAISINHPLKLVNPHIHYNKYVYLSNTNLVNSIRKKGVEVSFTIVDF